MDEDEVRQAERALASRTPMGSGGAAPSDGTDEVRQAERALATSSLRRTPMGSGGATPSDGTDGPARDEQVQAAAEPATPRSPATEPDLERIAGDLADAERALERLDDGSYWTDEVTGETLPDDLLAADPTARRAAYLPPEANDSPPAPA